MSQDDFEEEEFEEEDVNSPALQVGQLSLPTTFSAAPLAKLTAERGARTVTAKDGSNRASRHSSDSGSNSPEITAGAQV